MKPFAKGPSTTRLSGIRLIKNAAYGIPGVIHLEIGQPDFPTPQHIVDAACRAAQEGWTNYTPNAGLPSLRELIAEKLERDNHYKAAPDDIVVTAGGANAVFAGLLALVDYGEEVLIPDPYWPNVEGMVAAIISAVLKRYPLDPEDNFLPDMAALEKLVTDKTKVLLLNSPNNPVGSVLPRDRIEELMEFAQKRDLYLISDEPYEAIIFEGEHLSPAVFDSERVVSCYTFSKTYSMTGWRLGYAVAAPDLSKVITKVVANDISCASSISQKAGEAALSGSQDCVKMMVDSYHERRDAAVAILEANGIPHHKPEGAFYLWFDISQSGMGSTDWALALLKEQKVAVSPGEAFTGGASTYIRASLATEKQALVEGMERICSFLAS